MTISKELKEHFFKTADSGTPEELLELIETNPELLNEKDENNQNALFSAIYGGDFECVKILIDKGIDINSADNRGWTPLHEATFNGTAEMVAYLLSHKANVNACAHDVSIPLHQACVDGFEDTISILLNYGADPLLKDKEGRNAFDWAKFNAHYRKAKKIIKLLEQYSKNKL